MGTAQSLDGEVDRAFREALHTEPPPTALPQPPPGPELAPKPRPLPNPAEGMTEAMAEMADNVTGLVEKERMRFDETIRQQREILAMQREHFADMMTIQRQETEKVTRILEQFGVVDLAAALEEV